MKFLAKGFWVLESHTPSRLGSRNIIFCDDLDLLFNSYLKTYVFGTWPLLFTHVGCWKQDFSVQIYTFHAIPSKTLFWYLIPLSFISVGQKTEICICLYACVYKAPLYVKSPYDLCRASSVEGLHEVPFLCAKFIWHGKSALYACKTPLCMQIP